MTSCHRNRASRAVLAFGFVASAALGQFSGPGSGGEIYYNGGNVGIGTTSPERKLVISTDAGAPGPSFNGGVPLLRLEGNAADWSEPMLEFAEQTNPPIAAVAAKNVSAGAGDLLFLTRSNANEFVTERMRIKSNGSVGIGTTSPASGLHVIQTTGGANSNWYDPANYAATVHQDFNLPQHYGLLISDRWLSSENFIFAVDGRFTNGSGTVAEDTHNPYLIVRGDGKVGIGTTAPQYQLAVNGQIGAKEIIVTNSGWADYVFHPEYRLQPLSEVDKFIAANHHLPDIPSEAEVKENGIGVGEMQAKLLAKIEELTLHMIETDRINTHLQGQMIQSDARSTKLEKQNQELREELREIRENIAK